MKNNILIPFAMDFTSFVLERSKREKIKRIILFGSVARSEYDEESDVDIFVDVFDDNTLKKELEKIKSEYLKSKRYEDYWLLKDVKNEIKLTIGNLDKWKKLKNSIISNGLILYGKFEEMPEEAQHKTLFAWENIKPESKRVMLMKKLFGYSKGDKKYEGLLEKYKGERLGKGIITLPSSAADKFHQLFKKMKVTVRIKKIMEYK